MSEVRVKENESLDSALRRWKKSCARAGTLAEVRKREHYEKPSVRRKKKSEAARKRKFKYCVEKAGSGILPAFCLCFARKEELLCLYFFLPSIVGGSPM